MIVFYYLFLLIISILATGLFCRYAKQKGLVDIPNHRSSHVIVTPRGGGFVFIGIWLCCCLLAVALHWITWRISLALIPTTLLIATISYIDDHRHISAKVRFLFQSLAAIIVITVFGLNTQLQFGFFAIAITWLVIPFLFVLILWSINLFNFMDGMDGIASVEAIFIFSVGGWLIFCQHGQKLAYLLWALVILLVGFLIWNKPKAKIFMGDVGSACLGFLVLVTGVIAQTDYQLPFVIWLMLYGVFLFDASLTLIRRVLRREKWYQAHKQHAYQRLHQAGWSHAKVLLGLIIINCIIVCLVMLAYYFQQMIAIFIVLECLILLLVYYFVEKKKPM